MAAIYSTSDPGRNWPDPDPTFQKTGSRTHHIRDRILSDIKTYFFCCFMIKFNSKTNSYRFEKSHSLLSLVNMYYVKSLKKKFDGHIILTAKIRIQP